MSVRLALTDIYFPVYSSPFCCFVRAADIGLPGYVCFPSGSLSEVLASFPFFFNSIVWFWFFVVWFTSFWSCSVVVCRTRYAGISLA